VLNKDFHKANFVTIMSDGSTDPGIVEQELVYLRYVSDGLPKVKTVDVVDLKHSHADGVVAGIDRGLGKIVFSLEKFDGKYLMLLQYIVWLTIFNWKFWTQILHLFPRKAKGTVMFR